MSNVIKLSGRVDAQRLEGKINLVPSENAGGPLQAKTVYPSHSEQSIAPDEDYYGLAVVKVLAVPRLPACEVRVASEGAKVVEIEASVSVMVEVVEESAENETTHAYYNGVRLPSISKILLVTYPYAWIRNNTETGNCELFLSASSRILEGGRVGPYTTLSKMYTVKLANADEVTEWTHYNDYTDNFGIDEARPVLWSNHDILYKDSTEVYFYGSEPVPAE